MRRWRVQAVISPHRPLFILFAAVIYPPPPPQTLPPIDSIRACLMMFKCPRANLKFASSRFAWLRLAESKLHLEMSASKKPSKPKKKILLQRIRRKISGVPSRNRRGVSMGDVRGCGEGRQAMVVVCIIAGRCTGHHGTHTSYKVCADNTQKNAPAAAAAE